MPSRRVTFVLPFDDSNDEEGHDSDFENSFELEVEDELDLDKEILLFEDDDPDLDSKPEEGTSFIDIEEYLAEMALIEPPKLPPAKIPILAPNRPPPPSSKSRAIYDIGTRIQALTLLQEQKPVWQIAQICRMDETTVRRIRKRAIERGWDEENKALILMDHVTDAPRSGRPPLSQEICDEVIKVVTKNSTTRMYSCQNIADVVSENLGKDDIISASTVYRVLKKNGYGTYKPTVKPGLTKAMKEARYTWCLAHKDIN
jgi:Transposase/Homeodomain-like domain